MTAREPANRGAFPALPVAPGGADRPPEFLIHLPLAARDGDAVRAVAYLLARWWRAVPGADPAGVTVSRRDEPAVRHPVFCARPLAGAGRCLLRPAHRGECSAETDRVT